MQTPSKVRTLFKHEPRTYQPLNPKPKTSETLYPKPHAPKTRNPKSQKPVIATPICNPYRSLKETVKAKPQSQIPPGRLQLRSGLELDLRPFANHASSLGFRVLGLGL